MTYNPLHFQDHGLCFYQKVGFRAPKKGEFYLSGAIVEAYRAPNDLMTEYHVVVPTFKAVRQTIFVKGDPIS